MPLDKTNEMEQNEFVEGPPNNMVCFIVDFSTDWKQRIVFYEVQSPLYSLLTSSAPVLEDVLHKTFPKIASKDENIFFEMTKGSPLIRTKFFKPYTIGCVILEVLLLGKNGIHNRSSPNFIPII